MNRRFDHVDLRVRNLAEVRSFYEQLLPALGFTRDAQIEGWLQYEAIMSGETPEFVGVTESSQHIPNECRVAFRAGSIEEVDRLAGIVAQAGGRSIEGPVYEEPHYYAIFFEDPCGNRLEICCRG